MCQVGAVESGCRTTEKSHAPGGEAPHNGLMAVPVGTRARHGSPSAHHMGSAMWQCVR